MKLDVYRLFVMSLSQEESAPLLTFVSGLNKRRNSHEVNHSVAVLAFRSIHKIFEQLASFRRNLIHLQEWAPSYPIAYTLDTSPRLPCVLSIPYRSVLLS